MTAAPLSYRIWLPASYESTDKRYPVIYINGDIPLRETAAEVVRLTAQKGPLEDTADGAQADLTEDIGETAPEEFMMVCVQPESWNDDFTPWRAPSFRKGETDPAGRADAYLDRLTQEVKPYIDTHYRTMPEAENTAIFGYSLGGLTAVYAVYRTKVFGAAASLSGSLWYDGFCEYMEKQKPVRNDMRIYLSLGDKESASRNLRMSRVADCTQRAAAVLKDQAASVYFEWNKGGHFQDIPERFAKAVKWWQQDRMLRYRADSAAGQKH